MAKFSKSISISTMKRLLLLYIFFTVTILQAQKTDSLTEKQLEAVVISANKTAENKRFVAQPIQVLTAYRIAQLNAQTTADLLAQSGSVLVQRSQQGGGSPILRGFEASRVLLVIDGVRMNNLIYRAGHLQSVLTTDQSILERLEILQGPASTVYGSDALGGVIHLQTKSPEMLQPNAIKKQFFKGNAYVRYGTVNQEKTGHFDLNIGLKRFASLTSITFSDFGDLKMGKRTQALDTLWGLRSNYQAFINGKDSLVKNENPYLQTQSGYSQYDILQKFSFKGNFQPEYGIHANHRLNFQASNSSNIPRYDRLTDPRGTGLNQAEWYYGPQKRFMAAYEFGINRGKNGINPDDEPILLKINYQNVEESRHTRNFNNRNLTSRIENVNVVGSEIRLKFDGEDFSEGTWLEKHLLIVGVEGQLNWVDSKAFRRDIFKDTVGKASTRYPDGGGYMDFVSGYVSHRWKISDKWILNDGIRGSGYNIKAVFNDKTFYPLSISDYKQKINSAASGNLGLIYLPTDNTKFSFLASTGFRVPNIDDLGKVFDSQRGSVIVPNPNIKPERTYNLEFSPTIKFGDSWTFEGSVYYTHFTDAIVVDKFQFNGQDSIVYDGVMSRVFANQNQRKARILGFQSAIKGRIRGGVIFSAAYNFTKGRILNSESKETPLDHIPPIFGRLGLQYVNKKLDTEFFINYNGWKRLDDYLTNGEDNEQYATKDGMPAWWTINLRGSYAFTEGVKFQVGIDNLADIQYRVFASGIHAAGRNIYGTLRYRF
jgi:hemoglobin/transferrin/lactoferrin receptor protein